jgi:ribosomal protein S18 acetylase RimI-like enzyme
VAQVLIGGRRSNMDVQRLHTDAPLDQWAGAIERAVWDDSNAIDQAYTGTSLARFLASDDNVFIVAHERGEVLGVASGVLLYKPYGDARWLYVDEVDVAVPHRRRGVGKALMRALFAIAEASACEEIWLGTEPDNAPAIALYRGLDGDEAEVFGYTFAL